MILKKRIVQLHTPLPQYVHSLYVFSTIQGEGSNINLQTYPSPLPFEFTPSDLHHTVTFDVASVTRFFSIQPQNPIHSQIHLTCGFTNDSNNNIYMPRDVFVILQSEALLLQHNNYLAAIRNNTIINTFVSPFGQGDNVESKRESVFDECTVMPMGSLNITCSATRGNEGVVWFTDNANVAIEENDPRVGNFMEYGALPTTSPYTANLFFLYLSPEFSGYYSCSSALSGLSANFYLTTRKSHYNQYLVLTSTILLCVPSHFPSFFSLPLENPFVNALSPQLLTVNEGDPARLEFIVAINSDGSIWDEGSSINFYMVTSDGEPVSLLRSFFVLDEEFPQNYVLDITTTSRRDSGNYTARATSETKATIKVQY